jgi:hypothetical protein
MPKNKRPNRKPGAKAKRATAAKAQGGPAEAGSAPNLKGVKTYGSAKSARFSFTPAITRGSARGR